MTSKFAELKRRSDRMRQFERHIGLRAATSQQGCGRFSFHLLEANSLLSASLNPPADCNIEETRAEKARAPDRRSRRERRSGGDHRLDEDKFLQGERRSGMDRRWRSYRRSGSHPRYQSFEEAREFVRTLGLKSARDWLDYSKSGLRPDDIPLAPHLAYASDGWAGWSDWLGADGIAINLSRYQFLKKYRAELRNWFL